MSDPAGPTTRHNRAGAPAEPLAASWRPLGAETDVGQDGSAQDDSTRGGAAHGARLRRLLSVYGWRIYAVPLLAALTAFAVFQSIGPSAGSLLAESRDSQPTTPGDPVTPGEPAAPGNPPDSGERAAPGEAPTPGAAGGGSSTSGLDEPAVPAQPTEQDPSSARKSSAELPDGAPFPRTGAGTFDVLSGSSPQVGSGELYRYTVETEVGVDLAAGNDHFGNLVQQTLSDPRSWTNPRGDGLALQRVSDDGPRPDFRVILVSQQTAREVCGYDEGLPYDSSCRDDDAVYLNAARWVRGAVAFHGDMSSYRRYMINHEVGHVFGNGHVACPKDGAPAPVMMQQTFSTDNNELHDLNEAADQGAKIPADGATCTYSAWPFDRGGPDG